MSIGDSWTMDFSKRDGLICGFQRELRRVARRHTTHIVVAVDLSVDDFVCDHG
jgi:hypothetical protein